MAPAHPKIMIQEQIGGIRLRLPHRVLPVPLRNFGLLMLLVGFFFIGSGVRSLVIADGHGGAPKVALWITLGLIPLALGLLLRYSQTVVDLQEGQLIIRERLGWLALRRRFTLTDVDRMKVEELSLTGSDAPTLSDGEGLPSSVTILSANMRGRGRRVLVFGYGRELLVQLIAQIEGSRPP